ncbi:MAG: hypothetical protein ABFS34_12420 [Gemmatimonadota bacterium]
MGSNGPGLIDRARDELYSHIHRCGVLEADEDQVSEWMAETVEFLAKRYPDLSSAELNQLNDLGTRFCQPVIQNSRQHSPAEPEGATAA